MSAIDTTSITANQNGVPAPLLEAIMKANPGTDGNALTQQMTDLYQRFGDWQHVVAALHSNPAVVSKYGGVPPIPEVQAAVAQIMRGAGLPNAGAALPQGSPTGVGASPGLSLSAPAPNDIAAKIRQLQETLAQQHPGQPHQGLPNLHTRALGESNRIVPQIGGVGDSIVQVAQGYLGVPYKWGGTSRQGGMDCSGFIQNVFKDIGISLPRTTYDQVKVGQAVSLKHLQPGDVVFTEPGHAGPNHVGLYIGHGMIQESPHTGTVNSTIPLQDFLGGGFVAARRYTGLYQPKGGKKR